MGEEYLAAQRASEVHRAAADLRERNAKTCFKREAEAIDSPKAIPACRHFSKDTEGLSDWMMSRASSCKSGAETSDTAQNSIPLCRQ